MKLCGFGLLLKCYQCSGKTSTQLPESDRGKSKNLYFILINLYLVSEEGTILALIMKICIVFVST